MAEPYKPFTCPNCGSDRIVREGTSKFTCLSCGLTVTVGGGSRYAEKHVDEKELAEAVSRRLIKVQEEERSEKTRKKRRAFTAFWLISSIVLFFLGLIVQLVGGAQLLGVSVVLFLGSGTIMLVGGVALVLISLREGEKDNEIK